MPTTQTYASPDLTGSQTSTVSSQSSDSTSASAIAKAKQKVAQSLTGATERAQTALHSAKESARESLTEVETSFRNRPLAFVGGAFCLGLVIGLAIPSMNRERQALGPISQKLRKKGGELAHDIEERARAAAAAAEEQLTAGA